MPADLTDAETLAAARSNIVGPYVPARVEWLEGCIVPIRWRGVRDGPWRIGVWGPLGSSSETPVWGIVTSSDGHDVGYEKALDLTRPECRDLLIRRGAPEWAREIPAVLWVWASGGPVRAVASAPTFTNARCCAFSLAGQTAWWTDSPRDRDAFTDPVSDGHLGWAACGKHGPETGADARACIMLAALSHGCILAEPDGWLLPLADGGIGFWLMTEGGS